MTHTTRHDMTRPSGSLGHPAFVGIRRVARLAAVAVACGALAACGGDGKAPTNGAVDTTGTPPAGTPPGTGAPPTSGGTPQYSFTVVESWPHDPQAFTQGLLIQGGRLYESTGVEGQSSLRRVDLVSGTVLQRVSVPPQYFAEGLAALGGKLYQLTWRHGRAFVYDQATFAVRDTLAYTGEGWGLTTDGESLIMSDGTNRLRFLDPATFAVRRTVTVTDGASPVSQLNELEWVKGEILANVWMTDKIVRIDPATGKVTAWIDLTGILPLQSRTGREDVLNGIAYDAAADKLYVTGKYWPRLFQITLVPR
jgi:glutamine cyclotransferase